MSTYWGHDGTGWEPEGGERRDWKDLRDGDLIATFRAVWRVREVRPVPVADWDDDDRRYYEPSQAGLRRRGAGAGVTEEDWPGRPLYVTAEPANGGERRTVRIRPYVAFRKAYVLHPHYPVCRDCGEPWPCTELAITDEVTKQAAEVDRLAAILPGCCWGCGEPVTHRQKSIRFDGENLLLPGAPSAVFHLRNTCWREADGYESKWVPAVPGRKWRLRCPGTLTCHLDGSECDAGPECPGGDAAHYNTNRHLFRSVHEPGRITYTPMYPEAAGCGRCMDAASRGDVLGEAPPGALL